MSPDRRRQMIEDVIPTWVYRSIIAGAIGIIMYFVVDIHHDFERQKEKVSTLERISDNHEYRLSTIESKYK